MRYPALLTLLFAFVVLLPMNAGSAELNADITRRINSADRALEWVNKAIAQGKTDEHSLAQAQDEYDKIFQYYGGSFAPDNPQLAALKNRIDTARQAMGAAGKQKNIATPIEENQQAVADLPRQVGDDLVAVASALWTLENRLATAEASNTPSSYLAGVNNDLSIAKDKFNRFNSQHKGSFSTSHPAYLQVTSRLKKDAAAGAALNANVQSELKKQVTAQRATYGAEARRMMSKYQELPLTSQLSKKHKGRMVWAMQPISFNDQDRIIPKKKFSLNDPIFGRIYFNHSLANTPVYSKSDMYKPLENTSYGYIFKLFIDGEEKADSFGTFLSGNFNQAQGETWATWQFAPNPIPFDKDFGREAAAWRRTTGGLAPGTHAVRFELWGIQGQFQSKEPVSIGEFSLVVATGERISAGQSFPKDRYSGSDIEAVRSAMARALVGPVAKKRQEVLDVAVTGNWKEGVYTDSKNRYRKISGTILWTDTNNDSVCRFTTYNFIADHAGGTNWTPLRFKSFCNGCLEGDAECP